MAKFKQVPEIKTIFDALIVSVTALAVELPPEMRQMPKTTLEGKTDEQEGGGDWTGIGRAGKHLKPAPTTEPAPAAPAPGAGSASGHTDMPVDGGSTKEGEHL